MSFLSNIATIGNKTLGAINEQFTPGENTPRSLNSVDPSDPDRTNNFGTLGDFASKIDKSALRSYIETGLIRNVRPRNLEILMQEPEMTVLVKKRIFSSLIDNYRFDLMPAEDKLFIRATKKLLKCLLMIFQEAELPSAIVSFLVLLQLKKKFKPYTPIICQMSFYSFFILWK